MEDQQKFYLSASKGIGGKDEAAGERKVNDELDMSE